MNTTIPAIVIQDASFGTDRGWQNVLIVIDNDDDNSPLCDHGRLVCPECEAEMAEEMEL